MMKPGDICPGRMVCTVGETDCGLDCARCADAECECGLPWDQRRGPHTKRGLRLPPEVERTVKERTP